MLVKPYYIHSVTLATQVSAPGHFAPETLTPGQNFSLAAHDCGQVRGQSLVSVFG